MIGRRSSCGGERAGSQWFGRFHSRRASPFVRWSLSPILVFFGIVVASEGMAGVREGKLMAAALGFALALPCFFGILALWGVPYVDRVVTGFISLLFGFYLVDECFVSFDGWGFGSSRSSTTPINTMLGFVVFGFPCLIYTFLGRFSVRAPMALEEEYLEIEEEVESDDEKNDPKR